MLVSAIENFVLFNSVIAAFCFFAAWAIRRVARRVRVGPLSLSRVYAAAIVLPPIAAMWLVLAAFLPEALLGDQRFQAAHSSPLHELHMLGEMTARLEPVLAYLTIFSIVLIILFATWSTRRGYLQIENLVRNLDAGTMRPHLEHFRLLQKVAATSRLEVALVTSSHPFSFVWGFSRSKLLLSSGLLSALNDEELAGVLEHEVAHHRRRDNTVKLLLNLCCYTSIAFPLTRQLLKWRALEVELICDEIAAARTSAPLEIAEALVKLRRQTLAIASPSFAPAVSSFIPDDGQACERRVCRLLDLADRLPDAAQADTLSHPRIRAAVLLAGLFAGTISITTLLSPLAIHRAAESLIHLIG
jgi:Zn-dependent protease with chaperone function